MQKRSKVIGFSLILLSISCFSFGQGNLIANGSFELYSGVCPGSSPNGAFVQVTDWKPANAMAVHGVPHAELYCVGITPNYGGCMPGPPLPSLGDNYVGFHTRNITQPYNESIYQELPVPLIAGNNYRIEFDIQTCLSGIFTSGSSDFCVYANIDTVIPGCPTQNPSVLSIGCIPYIIINNQNWSHHQIDFIAPTNCNVLAFSGGACFTTDIYYYLDNVILTETTGLQQHSENSFLLINGTPADEMLQIEINRPGNFRTDIFSTTGQIVYSEILPGMQQHQILLKGVLADGIYFVKAEFENQVAVEKFVKY